MIRFSATVLILNVATVVTFATLPSALQLLLQRITQVLSVVMISHMFLSLKGSNCRRSNEAESRSPLSSCRMVRPEAHQTPISHETRGTVPKHMSNLVGNLGNELVHTSELNDWIFYEKVGKNRASLFYLFSLIAIL